MTKLIHETTKEHHDEYATITGGEGRAVLRKICMELIGGDIEALKEAYIADKNLNNIDEVMRKANTIVTVKNAGLPPSLTVGDVLGEPSRAMKNYHQQRKALHDVFKSRCRENGIVPTEGMLKFLEGPYTNDWFLAFDMQAPAFISATKKGRIKWKEINGGMHSGGVSSSTICSGLKHVFIFDILGCEFVEEKR